MATFNITDSSTVESLSKAFKDEFGATLQIYDGRLKAADNVKLVDIGAKTGSFECRASRTVGSFVKMMNDDFNLKVKVRTADNWVTVIDGLTLNRINDLPKQPTKTQMEDFVSYQRKDGVSKGEKDESKSSDNNSETKNEQDFKLPNPDAIYFVLNSEPRNIEDGDEECGEDWFIGFRAIKDGSYFYGVWKYDPNELADELGVDVEDIEIYDMYYGYDSNENFPSGKDIYLPQWLYEMYISPDSDLPELCPYQDAEPICAAINCCLTDESSDWKLDCEIPCILMKDNGQIVKTWIAQKG